MTPAVFIDRDGVVNRVVVRHGRPHPPNSLDEVEFFSGVAEAVQSLHFAGYSVVVVTNQPDVATGVQSREVVESIHAKIRLLFAVDDIKVCYHVDQDGCECRKPKPGLLLEAAYERSLNLAKSYMVGDRWRDIESGKAAGCKTILVRGETNYAERRAENPDAIVNSLLEASVLILSGALRSKGD